MSSTQTINKGQILIPVARFSIADALGAEALGQVEPVFEDADWLHEVGASFVTLTKQEQLRGCIGTLEAHRPLLEDVKSNAVAAAFKDPRFSPLSSDEFHLIEIEVSLLSAMQPMRFDGEQDALSQLQPGLDGVVFEFGHYRSTFLPQVWEQLPSTDEFMAHLKSKAGLSPDFWSDEVKLSRYTVSKWKERDLEVTQT